jgi:predicted amino acid dehydrogenase
MLATYLAGLWRIALVMFDYRGWYRWLSGQPPIDVAIITNIRDEAEGQVFWGDNWPTSGHSNGARIYLNGVAGQVRGIAVTAEELMTKEGRQRAKSIFIDAVIWAQKRGAKVILLAASTKRLFGRDGHELKQRFPDLLFTIGDNGTATLLCQDVDNALAKSGLNNSNARVLVLGCYGILGEAVTAHLTQRQFDVVGFGANKKALADMAAHYPIAIADTMDAVGPVDVVIACTHNADTRLTRASINALRQHNRKLLVVDVAEPANLDEATYQQCQTWVIRQDAGNAHSPLLSYVLGGISSRMLNLSPQVVFGCFAEALTLYHSIYREHNHVLLNQDWFQVNPANRAFIDNAFASVAIQCPDRCCFNKPVAAFTLETLSG